MSKRWWWFVVSVDTIEGEHTAAQQHSIKWELKYHAAIVTNEYSAKSLHMHSASSTIYYYILREYEHKHVNHQNQSIAIEFRHFDKEQINSKIMIIIIMVVVLMNMSIDPRFGVSECIKIICYKFIWSESNRDIYFVCTNR